MHSNQREFSGAREYQTIPFVAKSEFARVSQASGFYDVLDDYDVCFGTSAEDDSSRMTLRAEQATCLETYFAGVTAFESLAGTEGMRRYYRWEHDAGHQPSYAGPMWEPVPVEVEVKEDTEDKIQIQVTR
jgi:hypothetical protein